MLLAALHAASGIACVFWTAPLKLCFARAVWRPSKKRYHIGEQSKLTIMVLWTFMLNESTYSIPAAM